MERIFDTLGDEGDELRAERDFWRDVFLGAGWIPAAVVVPSTEGASAGCSQSGSVETSNLRLESPSGRPLASVREPRAT
jgi:hypothetical protein